MAKGKENRIYNVGTTADVNSLYPSMMHSQSGNRYPVGQPRFWKGDVIPDDALKTNRYYFIRIKTRFYLKKDKLPFIQIKDNRMYSGTECLETSDILDPVTGTYYTHYKGTDGEIKDTRVTMTLTMTDFTLLKEHYELVDFEILDGCYYLTEIGLFDDYIDKYRDIKMKSKGALRELAKLFLNNLYGKMASSTDSSFKVAFLKDDGSVGFTNVTEKEKKAGYIPVGSAITSYARNFTIRAAQANYHGANNRGFVYADTDSIHCDLKPDEIKSIVVDDNDFCCWKLESCWDTAIFTRQKTYIEHVVKENLKNVDTYYNIKCAGMPQKCKNLFEYSISCIIPIFRKVDNEVKKIEYTDEEKEFLSVVRTLQDFNIGLKVPGKLLPKRIPGGVLLTETTYQMR